MTENERAILELFGEETYSISLGNTITRKMLLGRGWIKWVPAQTDTYAITAAGKAALKKEEEVINVFLIDKEGKINEVGLDTARYKHAILNKQVKYLGTLYKQQTKRSFKEVEGGER